MHGVRDARKYLLEIVLSSHVISCCWQVGRVACFSLDEKLATFAVSAEHRLKYDEPQEAFFYQYVHF